MCILCDSGLPGVGEAVDASSEKLGIGYAKYIIILIILFAFFIIRKYYYKIKFKFNKKNRVIN